ncbi:MAG: hypothetical protein ACK59B_01740 [Alphaproteobacteria bacterium]
MKRILVGLAIVLALLVVTNPSRSEFNAWAQSHVARKIEEEARKKGINPNDGSSQLGGAIVGFFISSMPIERTNLLAFSIYSFSLPDGSGEERPCRFLGIAGQIVPMGNCLNR